MLGFSREPNMDIKLLLSMFFAVFALARPAHLRAGRIAKRDQPQIINGYTEGEITQLQDGFDDAMTLARTMQTAPAATLDPIFQKYFALSDKATVLRGFCPPPPLQKYLGPRSLTM